MLMGIKTIVYHESNLEAAKLWYSEIFGNVIGLIEIISSQSHAD